MPSLRLITLLAICLVSYTVQAEYVVHIADDSFTTWRVDGDTISAASQHTITGGLLTHTWGPDGRLYLLSNDWIKRVYSLTPGKSGLVEYKIPLRDSFRVVKSQREAICHELDGEDYYESGEWECDILSLILDFDVTEKNYLKILPLLHVPKNNRIQLWGCLAATGIENYERVECPVYRVFELQLERYVVKHAFYVDEPPSFEGPAYERELAYEKWWRYMDSPKASKERCWKKTHRRLKRRADRELCRGIKIPGDESEGPECEIFSRTVEIYKEGAPTKRLLVFEPDIDYLTEGNATEARRIYEMEGCRTRSTAKFDITDAVFGPNMLWAHPDGKQVTVRRGSKVLKRFPKGRILFAP